MPFLLTHLPQDEKVTFNSEHGGSFRLDLEDALTPDPGTEDMFHVPDNKFAFSPGQLSKLFNPKSLNSFYALGGLSGLERGLRTDVKGGLSTDEDAIDSAVSFAEVATKGAPKYGLQGDTEPEAGGEKSAGRFSITPDWETARDDAV